MLFRSEEGIGAWCARTGTPRGETLTLDETWALAQAWYADRMDSGFRGRTAAQAQDIFRQVGLTSGFWYLDDSAS